ncbi:carbohydrate ABC transporter permease [Paenibacillus rhizovicinus]|uniref:Carbohydrate ABC transporter permease n=1 Tax=Paenibacillus rhizovicinus TaxID=2704463 RepID=A0A6C0NY36_9BACL|nr:carbohydrate ABC transporter permease [Paenibacillus rhizovicinus]QHW31109.1 carbohydrate ABC transporter permease [Paenibacillus rhizovicinus]
MNAHRLQLLMNRLKDWLWVAVRNVLITGLSFVIVYPILQKASELFKDPVDIYNMNVVWVPEHYTMMNIRIVMNVLDYWHTLLNSILLSGGVMVIQTCICALAGYAFAKLKFRGINVLFSFVIFTILVPPQTIMVPLYMQFKSFDLFGLFHLLSGHSGINMLDTYWPLIISSFTGMGLKSGLFIYIFRQFFRSLPKELEEAAFVDGAGIGRTFLQIGLPNAIPALITVMLFTFVWQWNDTFFTNMYMGNMDLLSIKLGRIDPYIQKVLIGDANLLGFDPYQVSMLKDVAVLFVMLPLIVMYLFVQKYFVESVERTGLIG